MMASLENKIVLITGASSGIGADCARLFAAQKAKLILAARRTEKLSALKKELSSLTEVHTVTLDVRDYQAMQVAIDKLPAEWKSIDILLNNAGVSRGLAKIAEGNIEHWKEMIDTNLYGFLYTLRAVLPGMFARQKGHVINIGSISGREVYPGGSVYCATKSAVRSITQTLRLECLGTPLRVTEIAPGAVETEFSIVRYDGDIDRAKETYQGMTPLSGTDVARAVLFAANSDPEVNISEIILMSTDQAGVRTIHRRTENPA
jgi:3-hydroxy acid dehydrogenase/malonic semialdehyde reductase